MHHRWMLNWASQSCLYWAGKWYLYLEWGSLFLQLLSTSASACMQQTYFPAHYNCDCHGCTFFLGQEYAAFLKKDNPDISGEDAASRLLHSLTKRSPIISPLAPVKVPLAILGSALLGGITCSNPITCPAIPAVILKAFVSGALAVGR